MLILALNTCVATADTLTRTCTKFHLTFINVSLLSNNRVTIIFYYAITANYSLEVVEALPKDLDTGIYYGFASVDNGEVYKMVMSIGWNPFYDNTHKSMVS